jgi:hypothetical protein
MTDDEIREAAWQYVTYGGQDYADDWLDDEDEYPDLDVGVMRRTMSAMVRWMENQPPPPVEVRRD